MPDLVQNNSASTSKPSADSDRAAVADVLDNKGQEFRDDAGHPHPLYVAGTSPPPPRRGLSHTQALWLCSFSGLNA